MLAEHAFFGGEGSHLHPKQLIKKYLTSNMALSIRASVLSLGIAVKGVYELGWYNRQNVCVSSPLQIHMLKS